MSGNTSGPFFLFPSFGMDCVHRFLVDQEEDPDQTGEIRDVQSKEISWQWRSNKLTMGEPLWDAVSLLVKNAAKK